MKRSRYFMPLILVAAVVVDQFTKHLVATNMQLFQSIQIIPGFFSLTYIHNTGAAWSILEGKTIFFIIIGIVAIVILAAFYRHLGKHEYADRIGIILMIAGTIGNLIDRFLHVYVIDFLDFYIFNYNFPVFNIADTCLVIGVFIILISELRESLGVKHYGR